MRRHRRHRRPAPFGRGIGPCLGNDRRAGGRRRPPRHGKGDRGGRARRARRAAVRRSRRRSRGAVRPVPAGDPDTQGIVGSLGAGPAHAAPEAPRGEAFRPVHRGARGAPAPRQPGRAGGPHCKARQGRRRRRNRDAQRRAVRGHKPVPPGRPAPAGRTEERARARRPVPARGRSRAAPLSGGRGRRRKRRRADKGIRKGGNRSGRVRQGGQAAERKQHEDRNVLELIGMGGARRRPSEGAQGPRARPAPRGGAPPSGARARAGRAIGQVCGQPDIWAGRRAGPCRPP